MPVRRPDQLTATDLPQRFGRYELQCVLGKGGMGSVFGAELHGPAGFRKPVAIKVLQLELVNDLSESATAAFIREARLGGQLKHPNVIDVYELGEVDGQLFISMEWVRGLTVRQLIDRRQRPPPGAVLDIAIGIAAGLASAHALSADGQRAGLVHRDLKPSNVLLSWNGEVKVADFGIATTQHGELSEGALTFSDGRGTPSYMSPEQLLGGTIDGRSDLFALGLLLIELSTARLLPRQQLYQHLRQGGDPQTRLVSAHRLAEVEAAVPGLRRILLRCLEPVPTDRYDSAQSMLDALHTLRRATQSTAASQLSHWLKGVAKASASATDPSIGATFSELAPTTEPPPAGAPLEPAQPLQRTNLRAPLDRYVGREPELAALAQLFESGARLVTVKGMGGAGKTRFAQRFARRHLSHFEGGAWLVDLTEARSPKGLVQATAMALGVPLGRGDLSALVTQVGRAIRGRGQPLVIFDNFEQVVQHAHQTLGAWMAAAPDARFLVTSREALRLTGEHIHELPPLPDTHGVELFDLRARAAGARWQPTASHRTAVRQIVQKLDGVPLAIELAAAVAPFLAPDQLLSRLSDRFKLLRRGRRGSTDRQASLLGLVDWSWDLLQPWEKAALTQLSVFRDGFDMDAAEAVLELSAWPEAPWALDVVGALLDKSLLKSRHVDGQPRFGMYVTIQEYAANKLGEAAPATALRHAAWYASVGSERLLGPTAQATDRKALGLELDNFLAGVDAGDPELATLCALSAAELFLLHGPYSSGVELLQRVLDSPVDTAARRRLLFKLGQMRYYGGTPKEAQAPLQEALALAREARDHPLAASVLLILATILRLDGRTQEGLALYEEGLALHRAAGNIRGEAVALARIGLLYNSLGQGERAMAMLQEALRLHRQTKDREAEGSSLGHLGILLYEAGRYAEALTHYERALALHRQAGNRASEAGTLGDIGLIHFAQGRWAEGAKFSKASLAIARELGNPTMVGLMLGNLASAYVNQGQFSWAQSLYEEALQIAREVGNRRNEVLSMGNLGDVLRLQGDLQGAEAALRETIAISGDVLPVVTGVFSGSLALVQALNGQTEAALKRMDQADPKVRGVHQLEFGKFLCKRVLIEVLAGGPPSGADKALAEAEVIAKQLQVGPQSELGRWLARARKAVEQRSDR